LYGYTGDIDIWLPPIRYGGPNMLKTREMVTRKDLCLRRDPSESLVYFEYHFQPGQMTT